ncbi:excalibur calcium-binding domain-containing protein [Phenylobacterium sp. J426]|nr:excalibur calcium-binding domain-containing protein [Phenylobacterium sp. J426]MCR5874991.1 excalibur calcium-binding domain-containing protein [Phenylobacterium sp. J426]
MTCAQLRALGGARRGQPGYRPEWDGDNDGIACEPYRRRR